MNRATRFLAAATPAFPKENFGEDIDYIDF